MPLDVPSEPPTSDNVFDEAVTGPAGWDISQSDWDELRSGLSAAYVEPGARQRFLRDLRFPAKELPPSASSQADFWEHVRERAESGAASLSWQDLARLANEDQTASHQAIFTRLGGVGEPVTVGGLGEPVTGAPPLAGPPREAPESAIGSMGPTIRGYGELLPVGDRPDLRNALLESWEGRLGSWAELSDFQKKLLVLCREIIDQRGVGLIYAVTNSGKTTLARFGMTMAVSSGSTSMMLLPIKALVTQEHSEWQVLQGSGPDMTGLRIYPASRDYPENDRPVGAGSYDVALAIYEKLGVYLVHRMSPLRRSALLVVDELQMLAERSERAAKLEALLTLVKMLPRDQQPALLGLSAALSPAAGETLERWLGHDRLLRKHFTNVRPVPLDTYVVGPRRWLVQEKAHLLSMPGVDQTPPPRYEEEHELGGIRDKHAKALSLRFEGLPGSRLSTAPLAAALVVQTLIKDPDKRIIVFVPGRTIAQNLALAIQDLLQDTTGQKPAGRRGSPWQGGRYNGPESRARDAAGRLYERLKNSDLPLYDLVMRGLRHGVAFHTAALAPTLRRQVEDEFREPDGLLRVIVATDTLAVGLNLPADVVIATSVSGWGGEGTNRVRRLLPAADLDNKGGRAGRRLERTVTDQLGKFYILVPSPKDLQEIEGLTPQQVKTLSTEEGVYGTFVNNSERSLRVRSQFRDTLQISGLVLQALCQGRSGLTRRQWLQRVTEILGGLLISYEPDSPDIPEAEDVLRELDARNLIVFSEGEGYRGGEEVLSLSPLGQALGQSGLELDDAAELQHMAQLALENKGHLDLLWHAFKARSVQRVTAWVALPGPPTSHHMPSLKGAVLTLLCAHCLPGDSAEAPTRRHYSLRYIATKGPAVPDRLLSENNQQISDDLRRLLAVDEDDLTIEDANALLRAVVAWEWLNGTPYDEMAKRIGGVVQSSEQPDRGKRRAPSVKLYYADVEQLCEQVAGYLRATAELCVGEDGYDHSFRMHALAQRVESGLPTWLARVSRMRIPSLHRERLAKLAGDKELNHLSDLVNADVIKAVLDEQERETIRKTIESRMEDERKQLERIEGEVAGETIPGTEGETFAELSGDLDNAETAKEYLDRLCETMRDMGLHVTEPAMEGAFAVSVWTAPGTGATVEIMVPKQFSLTAEGAKAVAGRPARVIVRGADAGARRVLEEQGTQARFVTMEYLLQTLAHLVQDLQHAFSADQAVEELRKIRVSSIGRDW
ncbi:ATP-dependent RNA helicase HelY [Streptomyces sp. 840.1]|uniref:DEAD/DEAH box helicase n=1 Tax=Streptomyces sp. 840.1 TaxID=2485152 RepID=UPI000F4A96D5|nr:DEAD/DEAH box helicase [Streptomyces sp. 840.1]ROQ66340.1 ATP-dependent RNA helicase HelY [Streptomyces sp. 840.1]